MTALSREISKRIQSATTDDAVSRWTADHERGKATYRIWAVNYVAEAVSRLTKARLRTGLRRKIGGRHEGEKEPVSKETREISIAKHLILILLAYSWTRHTYVRTKYSMTTDMRKPSCNNHSKIHAPVGTAERRKYIE